MTALTVSACAGVGSFWLYTAVAMQWKGLGIGPRGPGRSRPHLISRVWLSQAGLDQVDPREFAAVVAALFGLGAVTGFVVLGGPLPALVLALFAAWFPIGSYQSRRTRRQERAHEAWPRLIEEIRVQTGSLGRSIPQALFEAGRRGPEELRTDFAAAHREWLLTTDLAATLTVLKDQMTDPSADMVCEALLVAHEVGGSDLDSRLADLAQDRMDDVQQRRDSRSRQAGARFARRFVLVVPAGMAAAGMSIGRGPDAYATPGGQTAVVVALVLIVACWSWAGRVMRLPRPERVFEP